MVPDKQRFYRQPERMPGLLERLAGANGEPGCISRVFADGERLTWGDVSCLYGPINGWFCPDDPDVSLLSSPAGGLLTICRALQAQPLLGLLPHPVLEDLPRRVHGEGFHKVHVPGHLVLGHV